tara:strand:+ start:520 stop:1728 length:1209 start_codon:yes stop_codon:yes gene_type:complete
MNGSLAKCPTWLAKLFEKKGREIGFSQFMDWALNHPKYGIYATGNLKIGKSGDFCTSPSLGPDFAYLLAIQLIDWFSQIESHEFVDKKLSLVEIGPGEGDLARDLILAINELSPDLINKLEYVLVEKNVGMSVLQKNKLRSIDCLQIRWTDFDELAKSPVVGVIIANEVLDALPVERFVFRNNNFYRQGVSLVVKDDNYFLDFADLPLTEELIEFLLNTDKILGMRLPTEKFCEGWSSEWHCNLSKWFEQTSKIIKKGNLLVIDYVLEARRYYNPMRSFGTIMSYKAQKATDNILHNPGLCDITSHLCLESLLFYSLIKGWDFIGETRQGQALLALGLAERLFSLQKLSGKELSIALERRESLLRLVDPSGLGEYRWILFNKSKENDINILQKNKFLCVPTT